MSESRQRASNRSLQLSSRWRFGTPRRDWLPRAQASLHREKKQVHVGSRLSKDFSNEKSKRTGLLLIAAQGRLGNDGSVARVVLVHVAQAAREQGLKLQ